MLTNRISILQQEEKLEVQQQFSSCATPSCALRGKGNLPFGERGLKRKIIAVRYLCGSRNGPEWRRFPVSASGRWQDLYGRFKMLISHLPISSNQVVVVKTRGAATCSSSACD
jgi:hypothetical protein